jgi:hypothetical protein
MKSISTFGSLVKNLNEENKNIKAPLKSYLDIDLNKDNFTARKEREHQERTYERPEVTDRTEKPRHVRQERPGTERHHHVDRDDGLQRPTFKNTALENKQNNFRDLDTNGDVCLIFLTF